MRTFKAELTIPAEQFGNIRPTIEGTAEEIVDAYFEFSRMVKPQEGLPHKEWNAALDRYLNDGTGDTEAYIAMSPAQQNVIQEIKKSFKRLKAKE
jgi:hypothetical protein